MSDPFPPGPPAAATTGCYTINLVWKRSASSTLPVHKYRLQRRLITGDAAKQAVVQFETIYAGPEALFTDTGLLPDTKYQYRVQAWNMMGRSAYVLSSIVRTQSLSVTCESGPETRRDAVERYRAATTVPEPTTIPLLLTPGLPSNVNIEMLAPASANAGASLPTSSPSSSASASSSPSSSWGVMDVLWSISDAFQTLQALMALGVMLAFLFFKRQGSQSPVSNPASPTITANTISSTNNYIHTHHHHTPSNGNSPTAAESTERCSVCQKRFGLKNKGSTGWRTKHICSKCHKPFCCDHGFTAHMAFLPCGVPGKCVCNPCYTN